jgi:hypothetical protein
MEAMLRRIVREEVLEALIHFANTQAQAQAPKAKKEKPAPTPVEPTPTPVTDKVVETVTSVLGNEYEVEVSAPSVEEVKVTEDMLRKLCVEVSNKLGNADRVKKVLAGFGGKIYQVNDLTGAYEAIKMLVETTNDNW